MNNLFVLVYTCDSIEKPQIIMEAYPEIERKVVKYIFCVCNNCEGINISFKQKYDFPSDNTYSKEIPVGIETFTERTTRRFTEWITVTVISKEKKNLSVRNLEISLWKKPKERINKNNKKLFFCFNHKKYFIVLSFWNSSMQTS